MLSRSKPYVWQGFNKSCMWIRSW